MSTHGSNLERPKAGKVTELFPYEMPFRSARAIAFLIILFSGAVGVASITVDWPETVEASFIMLPESGSDPIQSPFAGVIDQVYASTRGEVEAGALLFTVRSPLILELSVQKRTLEKDLAALSQRRDAAMESHAINRSIQEAEIKQREREVSYRIQHVSVYQDVSDRMKALTAEGLNSTVDLLSQQLGQAQAELDAALADEQFKAAQLTLARLDADHQHMMEEIALEEVRITVQLEGLEARLKDVADDVITVRSPYRGVILSVSRKRPGDVVSVGQELCQIAPADAPARAQLQLEERSMAKLREGQSAKLLFEAFPYQRFGVVNGKLTWLSPAALPGNEQGRFVAHVTPEKDRIGTDQLLRVGMGGKARIQVGRRTLIEYAFEPLRSLRENMRDQEASH